MQARRALLYMPAVDWRKIEKATTLNVDAICMDLEDGLVMSRKEEGRVTAVKALQTLDFGGAERLVRINPVGSGLEKNDLETVVPAGPDGILVPKVSSAEQIRWVSKQLERLERAGSEGFKPIKILALIETAQGIVHLKEIAGADTRLAALIFGAEDLAADLGARRTPEGWEVFYARSAVVTHAAAYDLDAIDMVKFEFEDLAGLAQEAAQGAGMGFVGKQVIHPNQIEVVQRAFTPSDEQIEEARAVLAAFNQHQEKGTGAFAIEGQLVDLVTVRAAEKVLERARAAGKT